MKRNLLLLLFCFSAATILGSCSKEKELLTESVSIKSAAVAGSITTVTVEGKSEITVTLPKAMKTGTTPIMLSPTFELVGNGYTISPASGSAQSFGLPSAVTPVVYTLTSPSGIKRLYSVRVLFHATL